MQVATLNLNGLRASLKKGLQDWVAATQYDVYAFQEIKIDATLVDSYRAHFPGYHFIAFPAVKKGYSGVAFLVRKEPQDLTRGIAADEFDAEGRNLMLDIGPLRIMNCYFPSGSAGDHRQASKERYLDVVEAQLGNWLSMPKPLLMLGDFNICHQAIDIHNPVSNKNSSGFLPHERAWMSRYLEAGFVDSFRHLYPEAVAYTWWSQRGQARAKNLGWRIDYQMLQSTSADWIESHVIDASVQLSDHCPTVLRLAVNL